MDFFAVKVNKMTGSDVIVGTLLERNGVCNGELYVFHERIRREFLLLNTCQIDVYSAPCPPAPTMTSLPVTILTAKKSMKMIFLNDKMCYIVFQKSPKIMNTQIPKPEIGTLNTGTTNQSNKFPNLVSYLPFRTIL